MICAIHQPQYLPWLGYFHKMAECDVFVFLDDVQYKKNEWQNRNRIKTSSGEQYLTVPVCYRFPQTLREVTPDSRQEWARKHLHALELNYRRAPYYNDYIGLLREVLTRPCASLAELNAAVVRLLSEALSINRRTLLSSELGVKGASTQRLVDICKAVGADAYLSGVGGKGYLDDKAFEAAGVRLCYQEFSHPVYPQVAFRKEEPFVPGMAAVDLLFNLGPESGPLLKGVRK